MSIGSDAYHERHSHWHELPMVVCPHCGKEFQWDDYCGYVGTGSRIECDHCEQPVYVVESYTAKHVCLAKQEENEG